MRTARLTSRSTKGRLEEETPETIIKDQEKDSIIVTIVIMIEIREAVALCRGTNRETKGMSGGASPQS